MSPQRLILVGLIALAISGAVRGNPPTDRGPLSEGREVDPVARDFFLPIPPSEPARAALARTEKPGDMVGGFLKELVEILLGTACFTHSHE
jgi:hypothetical protein